MTRDDVFSAAAAVADAVVYEGYVLYPYRPTSPKNRCRWQFGVVAPGAWACVDPSERAAVRTECVVAADGHGSPPTLLARVRLLRLQRRTVEAIGDHDTWEPVTSLAGPDGPITEWDEAVEELVELPTATAADTGTTIETAISFDGRMATEDVISNGGSIGRIVRTLSPLDGVARFEARWH